MVINNLLILVKAAKRQRHVQMNKEEVVKGLKVLGLQLRKNRKWDVWCSNAVCRTALGLNNPVVDRWMERRCQQYPKTAKKADYLNAYQFPEHIQCALCGSFFVVQPYIKRIVIRKQGRFRMPRVCMDCFAARRQSA